MTVMAQDEDNMYVHLNEATVVKVPINSVDHVDFVAAGDVESAVFTNAAKLAELSASIQNSVGNVTNKTFSYADFKQGYGWKGASKKVGTSVGETALSDYNCFKVAVTIGDYIRITTVGADACRAYYLVDADNKILELPGVNDGKTLNTFTTTVTNAATAYLLVNYNSSSYKASENIKVEIYSGVSGLMAMALSGSASSAGSETGSVSGLKFLNFGDSVAAGAKSNKVTWADMIAQLIDGTVLASPATAGHTLAQIRSQVETAIGKSYAPDVVFLEGGLNDMIGTNEESGGTDKEAYTVATFETAGIGLGTLKPYDFTAPDGTDLTFTGQVEYIMYKVKNKWKTAIPMWVLTHRTSKRDAQLQEVCYQRIIECAKKWGVVVIDVFHESGLNAVNSSVTPSGMTDDSNGGTHPTAAGYKKYYVPMMMDALNKYAKVYE